MIGTRLTHEVGVRSQDIHYAGDRYDPSNPLVPIPTKNVRLMLMNGGLWSKRLVMAICTDAARRPRRKA